MTPLAGALADTYGSLTPAAKLVGQLYAVASPASFDVTATRRMLARADCRIANRRVSSNDIVRCNAELVGAGIGFRLADEAAMAAEPAWVLPLTRAAHADGNLWRLLEVVQAGAYYGFGPFEERLLRAHLVAGNAAKVARMIERRMPVGFWGFLAEPWQGDLLATMDAWPAPLGLRGSRSGA
jgi:hypothetical protein